MHDTGTGQDREGSVTVELSEDIARKQRNLYLAPLFAAAGPLLDGQKDGEAAVVQALRNLPFAIRFHANYKPLGRICWIHLRQAEHWRRESTCGASLAGDFDHAPPRRCPPLLFQVRFGTTINTAGVLQKPPRLDGQNWFQSGGANEMHSGGELSGRFLL